MPKKDSSSTQSEPAEPEAMQEPVTTQAQQQPTPQSPTPIAAHKQTTFDYSNPFIWIVAALVVIVVFFSGFMIGRVSGHGARGMRERGGFERMERGSSNNNFPSQRGANSNSNTPSQSVPSV